MGDARSMREALVAVMLEDIDKILERAESLPDAITEAEKTLKISTVALEAASDKYRMAITAFTEEARTELLEFLQRKAGEVAAKTVEEQRAAMQEAARAAFRFQATERAEKLGVALANAASEFRRSRYSRLAELCVASICTSALTAVVVIYLQKWWQ